MKHGTRTGRKSRGAVLQRRPHSANESAWALSAGSALLLLALLFGAPA